MRSCWIPALFAVAIAPAPLTAQQPPATYWVYVGAESADLLHLIRFGPGGASVEKTIPVGEMQVETEGPHGLRMSRDGRYLYMTTGHGIPDGKLWKIETGADTVVGDPILLGRFPATLDLTPDDLYAFVVNFNLHGEREPSSISVVYTPDLMEITQTPTCTQPHGGRMHPSGTSWLTDCVVDDQLVEIDTETFEVARRFNVAVDQEGPLDHFDAAEYTPNTPTCAPTWAVTTPSGDRVFVACNRANHILEIEYEAWSLRRRIATGRGPYNLDVSPDGKTLVATLKQGAAVQFIDVESGTSRGVIPSSTTVTHGVVVSPDSRYAFVSVEGVGAEPGKVDIYDLQTLERVADVPVAQQAGGITFWKMDPAAPPHHPEAPHTTPRQAPHTTPHQAQPSPAPGVRGEGPDPRHLVGGGVGGPAGVAAGGLVGGGEGGLGLGGAAGGAFRQTSADSYTRYELLEPASQSFRIIYDVTATTPGATVFFNPIRRGSEPAVHAVYDRMTGQALPWVIVDGTAARAEGMENADPDGQYIRVTLARPVPQGGETRLRIDKTYRDPATYTANGDEIRFERSLGIRRNAIVLPLGYELTGTNYPSQVVTESDGRIKVSFMNSGPGAVTHVILGRKLPAPPSAATEPPGVSTTETSATTTQTVPAGARLGYRFSERAFQDREIVYFLQQPETHSFRLYHDYTEGRAGTDRYVNVVRSGSRASNPSATLLDTGEPLRVETLHGEEIRDRGIEIGGEITPETEVVVIWFDPVRQGQSVRLRIEETYTDSSRYLQVGDELIWDRSFGRPRNTVVLPDGWYLTANAVPAVIDTTGDGQVRLYYENDRPGNIDVFVKARRR